MSKVSEGPESSTEGGQGKAYVEVHRPKEICCKLRLDKLRCQVLPRPHLHESGIVDNHVNLAECFDGFCSTLVKLVLRGSDVELNSCHGAGLEVFNR